MDKGIKEDALWRSTARRGWWMVITEVFHRFSEQIPGAPPTVCKTSLNSSDGGTERGEPDEMDGPDRGMAVPDL